MVLASSMLLLVGVSAGTAQAATYEGGSGACTVTSLPSFTAQGESQFGTTAMVADVLEVSCNPYAYSDGAPVTLSAYQLWLRCDKHLKWLNPNNGGHPEYTEGSEYQGIKLDADGNANVAVIGGPECLAGESLITLDEEDAPYETFTTSFLVLPPGPTETGLTILHPSQVEDSDSSGAIAIAEFEDRSLPEESIRIGAKQLYDSCHEGLWIVGQGPGQFSVDEPELTDAINTDDDGNGFAILKGTDSCHEGTSLIEADAEYEPNTTLTASFTVESPMVRWEAPAA
jgi:hypothetical protein